MTASTAREQASNLYNELLNQVGDLLGPDHKDLWLKLDRAVGAYSNEVASSAVREHGLQILEMIKGEDFEYEFLEEC